MLKIGEFSKLGRVSPKTLRLYDERGLLRPAWIDRFTGYRYYKPQQLSALHRILALKDLGFSLDQIGELLAGESGPQELGQMMRERQKALSRHIAAEEARLLRVEARLRQIELAGRLPRHDVVLKPVRPMTVAGMRRRLADQGELPDLLDAFQCELRRQGLPLPEPVMGLYYDRVFRESSLDVEAAVPLHGRPSTGGEITVHELPGEELMACTVHRGPYELLPQAYEAVFSWLDSSGYQAAGPNRDLFLQLPTPGEAQDQAVTEVQFPVRPKPFFSSVAKFKDKKEMDIKIVTKPEFTVVGMPYFGKNENKEIPEMWGVFLPRAAEIGHTDEQCCYGLCSAAEADGRFRYLAGFGVSEIEDVPEGMESWTVPEETYAVFPCELSTLSETYRYAFETWLPQSEFQYKKGIDFELYTEDFDPATGEESMLVYIPVEKKAD